MKVTIEIIFSIISNFDLGTNLITVQIEQTTLPVCICALNSVGTQKKAESSRKLIIRMKCIWTAFTRTTC
jgi:hypothetical protein